MAALAGESDASRHRFHAAAKRLVRALRATASPERARLLGVTLTGPPPLGRVFLTLQPGLTVLYGVNGAGKSTVLRGLESATTGIVLDDCDATVHIEISEPYEPLSAFERGDELARELLRVGCNNIDELPRAWGHVGWRAQDFGLNPDDVANQTPGEFLQGNESIGAAVESFLRWWCPHDPTEVDLEFARQAAAQGIFNLTACGTEAPAWRVTVGCRAEERARVVSERINFEIRYQRWRSSEGRVQVADIPDEWLETYTADYIEDPRMAPDGAETDAALIVDRPGWAPYSLIDFGVVKGTFVAGWPPVLIGTEVEVADATLRASTTSIADEPLSLISSATDDEWLVADTPAERLRSIGQRSNSLFQRLQIDAPALRVRVRHPNEWIKAHPISWTALDVSSGAEVEISLLSSMQERLARFAISSAVEPLAELGAPLRSRTTGIDLHAIGVIDEPERGAHRLAIQHLIAGLTHFAESTGAAIFVASHAPEFLASRTARLMHVRRRPDGLAEVQQMDDGFRSRLTDEDFGASPGDLLQIYRTFLLVEGHHDQVLLKALVGDDLATLRCHILPVRGARKLNAVLDSQFLFDFTLANVVALVDNVHGGHAHDIWTRAREAARNGDVVAAKATLREFSGKVDEERFLREFCQKAIGKQQMDRIEVSALEKSDIIEYLPVDMIVPGAISWDDLKNRHRAHIGKPFKSWLADDLGATFSDEVLIEAAESLDHVPPDIVALLALVESLSSMPRAL